MGYNLFRLDKEVKVEAGDLVGANQPGAPLGGTITFTLDGSADPSPYCIATLDRTTLLWFGNSTDFSCSTNRTYSLRAFGQNSDE